MQIDQKECVHVSQLIEKAIQALKQKNALALKELSNQTVHSSCNYQDPASITLAIILYALSKLIERSDYDKIKNWDVFVKKINSTFDLAVKALKDNNQDAYQNYIQKARQALTSESISIKKYIEDILKKAAINKGSRIYEHGISIEQTSQLLGISQWELSEYIGQITLKDEKHSITIDTKKRAKLALEFFE